MRFFLRLNWETRCVGFLLLKICYFYLYFLHFFPTDCRQQFKSKKNPETFYILFLYQAIFLKLRKPSTKFPF